MSQELVFLLFAVIFFVVLMRTVVTIYRMRLTASQGGDISKRSGRTSADDMRTIQEIYKGLENLNQRVEALETILLDRVKKG